MAHCSNNMLDKCSLSPQASIMELRQTACFTSADCRNKHKSWIWSRSMSRGSEIMELSTLACFASARCRHIHKPRSCEHLDALQMMTVATSINHAAANKQDALQVLTVATSINHVAAKSWMLYMCSLSHQA